LQEAAILEHPAQFEAFNNITALIDSVRQSYSPTQYRAVQQRLAHYIEEVDHAASTAKMEREQADDRLRRMAKRKNGIDESARVALEEARTGADSQCELFLRLGRQYRAVGDAIAWQLYDFRSISLVALGMNQSPGPLANKAGAEAEADAVEEFWEQEDAFALRHDYTNILRVADLSVFSPGKPLWIYEVKAGAGKHVGGKQKRRMERVPALTMGHMTRGLDGGYLIHQAYERLPADGTITSNLNLFTEGINEAEQSGVGTATNSYLAVSAINLLHPDLQPPDAAMLERIRHIREDIPSEVSMPPCISYLVADSMMKSTEKGYGAPYTIYPFPPQICARLVTGYLRLHIVLNTAAVTNAYRRAGFETVCLLEAKGRPVEHRRANDPYYVLRKGGKQILIGPLPREQVLFEGLTLESFVASAQLTDAEREPRSPSGILLPVNSVKFLYTSEVVEAIWRSSRTYLHEQ
jgi:hypothetical protein